MAELEDQETDPFSSENAPGLALIVQMRIYDVLLAMYREMNPDMYMQLIEAHRNGKTLGPLPHFDPGTTSEDK